MSSLNREHFRQRTLVIGAGPAGMAFAAAGDTAMHERGAVYLEKKVDSLGPGLFAVFNATSPDSATTNSPGSEFAQPVQGTILASALETEAGKRVDSFGDSIFPLKYLNPYFQALGWELREQVGNKFPRSDIQTGTPVGAIVIKETENGVLYQAVQNGVILAEGSEVVIATGGSQKIDQSLLPWIDKVLTSEQFLSGVKLNNADKKLPQKGDQRLALVPIMGGAHSAILSAHVLMEALPDVNWGEGSIVIVHTSPIKIFFPSKEAARVAGYPVSEKDMDPERGSINRFDGVRGPSAELYLKVLEGRENRVRFVQYDGDTQGEGVRQMLTAADMIVQANGYRADHTAPSIYLGEEKPDRRIGPRFDSRGHVLVDRQARVITTMGTIPDLYANSMCAGLPVVSANGESISGDESYTRRREGFNTFNDVAVKIIWPQIGVK